MMSQTQQRNINRKTISYKNLEKIFFFISKNKTHYHLIPDQLIKHNIPNNNDKQEFISYDFRGTIDYTVQSIDEKQEIQSKHEAQLWDNEIIELMVKAMRVNEEGIFYVSSQLSPMITQYIINKIPLKVTIRVKQKEQIQYNTSDIFTYLQIQRFSTQQKQLILQNCLQLAQDYLKKDNFKQAITQYQQIIIYLYDNPTHFHNILMSYFDQSQYIKFSELPCTYNLMHNNRLSDEQHKQTERIFVQRIEIRLQLIDAMCNHQYYRQACYQIFCAVSEILCFKHTLEYDKLLEKCIEKLLIIDSHILNILQARVFIIQLADQAQATERIKEIMQRNKQLQEDEIYIISIKYKHYIEKINVESLSQITYSDTIAITNDEIKDELKANNDIFIKLDLQSITSNTSFDVQIQKIQKYLDEGIEHQKFGNVKKAVIQFYIGLYSLKLDSLSRQCSYDIINIVKQIDQLSNEFNQEQKNKVVQLRTKLFRRISLCYQSINDEKNSLLFSTLCIMSQLKDLVFDTVLLQKSLEIIFNIYSRLNDYDNLKILAQNYIETEKLTFHEEPFKILKDFQKKVEVFHAKFANQTQKLVNYKYKNIFSNKK